MSVVVASITLRAVLGRRRILLLLLLPLLVVGLAAILAGFGVSGTEGGLFMERLAIGAVLPLMGLLASTGVIASEIDDGVIVYLLAKPVSRWLIAFTKLGVAIAIVVAFAVLPTLVAGLLLTGPVPAIGYTAGALAAGVAYCAIFFMISVLTRHAVAVGVMYALIWEGLIGGFIPGARNLSVQQWGLSVADAVAPSSVAPPAVAIGVAAPALIAVTAAPAAVAAWRLRRLELSADL